MSEVVHDLVQVKDHPEWKVLADLKKYISENHHNKGKFNFCNEHKEDFLFEQLLPHSFFNKSKTEFKRILILIPDISNTLKQHDTALLTNTY